MKLLYTTTLLLFGIALSAQYNYGLEVEQQDAKIEGKLNLNSEGDNIIIGSSAGINIIPVPGVGGVDNVFIGDHAGNTNVNGYSNVVIGSRANWLSAGGSSNVFLGASSGIHNNRFHNVFVGRSSGAVNSGYGNAFIGFYAGGNNTNGSLNTFVGEWAGSNSVGSLNVFIGNNSGSDEDGSNKLYIENSTSSAPLIYGEFDNDRAGINWDSSIPLPATLSVNGTLHISETAKLEPQATAPTCGATDLGLMYVDATDSKLYLCKGSLGWKEVMVSP